MSIRHDDHDVGHRQVDEAPVHRVGRVIQVEDRADHVHLTSHSRSKCSDASQQWDSLLFAAAGSEPANRVPSIWTASSAFGFQPEQVEDRRRDLRRLDPRVVHARLRRSRRVDDDRHVAVGRVGAAVLGDLAAAGVHHTDLDHTPHVRVPRIADRYPEVPRGGLAGVDLRPAPSAPTCASCRRRRRRSPSGSTGSPSRNPRPAWERVGQVALPRVVVGPGDDQGSRRLGELRPRRR